jgi:hypothetical protein
MVYLMLIIIAILIYFWIEDAKKMVIEEIELLESSYLRLEGEVRELRNRLVVDENGVRVYEEKNKSGIGV